MTIVYQKIIQYIDANLNDEISITKIAEMVGYSQNHVNKLFKVYSPYPIMEYIRRKKLYAAANEMYTGKKLYDIALDYGYMTPAGFYKAFKAVMGCSPQEYKNNNKEGKNDMFIEHVKNLEELDTILSFCRVIYPDVVFMGAEGDEKYSRSFWIKQWKENPELLLFAKNENRVCGIVIGWVDGQSVTVAMDGVSEDCAESGIHEALFVEIEKRAKAVNCKGVVLGIGEGKEEFYAKMGYVGKILIQSEKYSVDKLKDFNKQHGNYEITGTNIYEGYVNQIWLNVSLLDKTLKQTYEKEIGDCWVQVIVSKAI